MPRSWAKCWAANTISISFWRAWRRKAAMRRWPTNWRSSRNLLANAANDYAAMLWNLDDGFTLSLQRLSQNASPSSPVNERKTVSSAYSAVVSFKIFDSRSCVENDHAFAGRDFPGMAKQF